MSNFTIFLGFIVLNRISGVLTQKKNQVARSVGMVTFYLYLVDKSPILAIAFGIDCW